MTLTGISIGYGATPYGYGAFGGGLIPATVTPPSGYYFGPWLIFARRRAIR